MTLLRLPGRPLGRSGSIEPLTLQRVPHKPQYVAGQGVTHRLRSLPQRGAVLCGHSHRKLNFLCHYAGILWLTLVDGIARIPLRHDGVQGDRVVRSLNTGEST